MMKNIELTIFHDGKESVFSGEGDVRIISTGLPELDYFKENKINPSDKQLVRVDVLTVYGEDARNKQKIFSIHDKCILKVDDDFYTGEYATWSRINGQPIIIVDI